MVHATEARAIAASFFIPIVPLSIASTSVAKRDLCRLCLYFVRANAGHALELVQTLDIAILFPVRDDRLGFFLCQTQRFLKLRSVRFVYVRLAEVLREIRGPVHNLRL